MTHSWAFPSPTLICRVPIPRLCEEVGGNARQPAEATRVEAITAMGHSSICRLMHAKASPPPARFGTTAGWWSASDITAWLGSLPIG